MRKLDKMPLVLSQILEFQSLQQYSVTHQHYNGSSVVNWHYNRPEVTDNMTVASANGLKIVHERLIKRKKACAPENAQPFGAATVPSTRSVTY